MQPTAKYSFKVYADHLQFDILDKVPSQEFWAQFKGFSTGSYEARIEIGEGIIQVLTSCCDSVSIELELYQTEPALEDFADWQHITEASIKVVSEAIYLVGELDVDFKIPLDAGTYRTRIYYYGLENPYIIKGDDEDYYKVQLWPAEYSSLTIVKWYRPQNRLISCGISKKTAKNLLKDLEEKYSDKGRYYHTYFHILKVLLFVDRLKQGAKNFAAVQLAAYYHDVIYDTRTKDNEEQSAEYAAKVLGEAGISAETIAEVKRLILATKTHQADPADTDCKIMLDADLAVLGSSPELYDIYSDEIRQEYHWVAEADYRAGRKLVLENFLKRERIYYTDYMHQQYEALARENITREINILSQEI